ncbi:MAG: exo-alpha-sialidase [Chloroflexia bacterium]|nr:exo-alpha-sialidase [Chloroflexia bacterium]
MTVGRSGSLRPRRDRGVGAFITTRSLALLALAALLFSMIPPLTTRAEEAGEAIPLGDFRLLEPVEDMLSAGSWVMATGQDPRLMDIPTAGSARGVDWTGYGVVPGGNGARPGSYQPQVPFRSAAPAFSRNQIVSRQLGLFPLNTEPHLAVNPLDPEHLVLGVIDYNFPSMSTYVSFDGGETWEGPNQLRYFQEDFGAAGDPVLAFDRDGNVFMVSISLGFEEFRLGTLVSATEISSIVISKSEDDGLTWGDAVSTARSTVETTSVVDETGRERGELAADFLDKPWISIGPDPADPERDIIYVAYTEFKTRYTTLYADELPFLTSPVTETTIRLVRSTDGGATWSDPIGVSPTVFQAEGASEEGEAGVSAADGQTDEQTDDDEISPRTQEEGVAAGNEADQTVQGPQPAVMADGTVVVAYLDTTLDGVQEGLARIMVTLSADAGRTFAEPVQAGVFREIHFRPRNSFFRWWGSAFPQLTVGTGDEIYVAVTAKPGDKPTDDGDIFLLRSLDKGATWDPPLRINADDTDRIQFFPAIDVAPDGSVHAMWGDMRDDPQEARFHIYYSESEDQGATWGFVDEQIGLNTPDTRVTDFASNSLRGFPGGRFLGDYFAIATAEEDVYLVWADTRLGEYGGPNQQVGFARKRAVAPPSLFLNPPNGDAGRDVAIQGFGFQPDSDITIDVGGITITNLLSNDRGEFQTNVYMPVTGEGARNVSAYDETGNVATASFFTEFGFDSIARELGELREDLGPAAATPVAEPAELP